MRVNFNFTKKHLAVLVFAVWLFFVVGGVLAGWANPSTLVGHNYSELQPCGTSGDILKISNGGWVCQQDSGGDVWTVNGPDTYYPSSGSGNVGIGVSSPVAKLHVFSGSSSGQPPTNVEGIFVENNGTSAGSYVFQAATGYGRIFSIANSGDILISSEGRVGIGTAAPVALLEVNGNMRVNRFLDLRDYSGDASKPDARILGRDGSTVFFKGGVAVGNYDNGELNGASTGDFLVKNNIGVGNFYTNYEMNVEGDSRVTGTFSVTDSSPDTYLYSTNTYLGGDSGDNIRLRKSVMTGDNFKLNGTSGSLMLGSATINPGISKLYVSGQAKITDGLEVLGNIGVGNFYTNYEMNVEGDSRVTGTFFVTDSSPDTYLYSTNTYLYSTNTYLGSSSGDNIYLRRNVMTGHNFKLNGNSGSLMLGSATINPGNYELYVSGQAKITGGLEVSGNSYGVSGTGNSYGVKGMGTGSGSYGVFGTSFGGGTGTGVVGTGNTGVYGNGNVHDFYATGSGGDYDSASSIRWKKNVRPIENSLQTVLNLRGVSFDWNEDYGGQHDIGLIAEEVGLYVPEIVVFEEDNSGYAVGLDYSRLVAVLIEAVKEQQQQIEELKNQIKELKSS